ncbi:MAG: phosphoribosylglycinamide formyltransferase [Solirubrobacterales bacterium]
MDRRSFPRPVRPGQFRVAVLASGTGTNLQAILDKVHGRDGIEVVAVASNNREAIALERAAAAGIETDVFDRPSYPDREARDYAIAEWLAKRRVDLIVLAGYMELMSSAFVARFRNRIVNVHPALLPSFPGLAAVQQALDHGVKVTGVTVHFVDEGVDSGPIIVQRAVEVPPSREWQELEDRIHAVEHELLPEVVRLIAAGSVRVDGDNARVVTVAPDSSGR